MHFCEKCGNMFYIKLTDNDNIYIIVENVVMKIKN